MLDELYRIILKKQPHTLQKCGANVLSDGAILFAAAVAVAAHELVDATGGIDEFLLAGEEGVR